MPITNQQSDSLQRSQTLAAAKDIRGSQTERVSVGWGQASLIHSWSKPPEEEKKAPQKPVKQKPLFGKDALSAYN